MFPCQPYRSPNHGCHVRFWRIGDYSINWILETGVNPISTNTLSQALFLNKMIL